MGEVKVSEEDRREALRILGIGEWATVTTTDAGIAMIRRVATLVARLRAAEQDRERLEDRLLHQIRRFRYLDDLLFVDTSVHPPAYMIGPIPMHDCPDPKNANVRAAVDAAIDRAMGGENDAQ